VDNLCHTLVGAALGEAGLNRRTRFGTATLMMAANLPDVDVLVFATETPAVAFRRGWTHGPIAQVLLPVALTAVIVGVARLRGRAETTPLRTRGVLLLAYVGMLSHVGLDLLNPYGLRLFAPFDWRWLYGDTLFILDPWLWGVLGAGVWLARRRRAPAPARGALLAAAVYIAVMAVAARGAREAVIEAWRHAHGREPAAVMVGPVPVTPFERQIVVDAGTHYETGTFEWLPMRITFDAAAVPKNDTDPRVARARAAPHIRGFLVWARFPFWTVEPTPYGTRVSVGDLRFAGRGSPFVQSTVVEETEAR
jgi:inner membrane protein